MVQNDPTSRCEQVTMSTLERISGKLPFNFFSKIRNFFAEGKQPVLKKCFKYGKFQMLSALVILSAKVRVLDRCVSHVAGPTQAALHTTNVMAFGDEQDQETVFYASLNEGSVVLCLRELLPSE